ncbi:integrin alpha-E-like [Hemicordylus capensis]|uniref:integrin alpha-E-like n=1 Tax=Hemicordylus capensis TaxID=884348 RepID=UPI002302A516|nr:integrin alpha-E-like [Hemicordylus capensis]
MGLNSARWTSTKMGPQTACWLEPRFSTSMGRKGRFTSIVWITSSRPVIRLVPAAQFTPGQILNFYNSCLITAQVCFGRTDSLEASQPGMQNLHIRYTLDLDVEMDKKRAQFEDHATTATREIFYQGPVCSELQFQILPCVYDCFSSVVLRLGYQLLDDPVYHDLRHPLPVLDIYQGSELYVQLPYEDACKEKTACTPHLSLTLQAVKDLVAGHTKDLTLTIFLGNSEDSSYMTWLVLEYLTNLLFKNVQELSSTVVDCDAPKSAATLLSSLSCKVGHPVFETTTANFSVTWQVDGKRFPGNLANVTVNVTNINRNSTALVKKHSVDVKYALTAILSRPSKRVYVSVHERSPQSARFEFKINGKNQFGAELSPGLSGHAPGCQGQDSVGVAEFHHVQN